MTPGPVPVPQKVLEILSEPMEHHRTPEFQAVLKRVLTKLPSVFGTSQPAFIHTSTGSGGLESALVNVLSPGDEVLSLITGKFGDRWAKMAEAYGAKVTRVVTEPGRAVTVEQVSAALQKNSNFKIVLCQACETSSAVLNPIKEIAAVTRKTQALLLVDGITALGAFPMPMDEWGIDCVVGGSQKAFMLPTGLSFISFSARAWERIETAKCPRFYFDIRKERKANQGGETLFSASVPMIKALEYVLSEIEKNGIESIQARVQKLAQATHLAGKELGLESFSKNPSPTVTALTVPDGIDGVKLRNEMENVHKVVIMGGQDELKGKIIRIGHMGAIENKDMLVTIQALGETLKRMKPETFTQDRIDRAVAACKKALG
jgi:aspartate aminotransferase-like enzyme